MLNNSKEMNLTSSVLVSPQTLEEAPSPRFVGTHMHPDNIHASFYEKKTKVSFSLSLKEPQTDMFSLLLYFTPLF